MDTINVLTEIAQKYRFTPLFPDIHWSKTRNFVKFRKDRTRRTRGVRTVSDGRSGLGVIEIDVWYKGSDIWFNRSKKVSLCEPDSLHRLEKYFKRAK